jgi:hypothetical protein
MHEWSYVYKHQMHIKEEVREDLYMQAGLQSPYCMSIFFLTYA